MPYTNMSLEDFARHVGMRIDEVRRLAERGKLPGHKVGGQWRFNRAQVTEWLQQEIPTYDHDRLLELERAMGVDASLPGDDRMIVTELIALEGIETVLPANTKASVLRELVVLAGRTGLLYDGEGLLEAIQQREEMCSTALPAGVAIPHPRQPMPYASAEPLICAARSTRGIPFGSPYGGLTSLFFLICCHDDRHHLRVLARLVRILDTDLIARLRETEAPDVFLQRLIDKEEQVIRAMK
jgi:PTS system nitrogen regulatory IIA component